MNAPLSGRAVVARARASFTVVAWITFLVAGLVVLVLAGRLALGTPPLRSLPALERWASIQRPDTAAFALLRVAALGLGAYLLLATVLTLCSDVLRAAALIRVNERFSPELIRRLVAGAVTTTVLSAPLGIDPALAAPAPPPTASALPTTASAPPTTCPASPTTSPPSPATVFFRPDPGPSLPAPVGPPPTLRVLDAETTTTVRSPSGAATAVTEAAIPSPEPGSPPPASSAVWTVRTGDNFWDIAADVLERSWGRRPRDPEIAPYWERLISANAGRLAVPSEPSLLFPGQSLVVPPPPGPPA